MTSKQQAVAETVDAIVALIKERLAVEQLEAVSVPTFCKMNGPISPSFYYKLPKEDRPVEMVVGGRRLISPEARAEWRRRMEAKAREAKENLRDKE